MIQFKGSRRVLTQLDVYLCLEGSEGLLFEVLAGLTGALFSSELRFRLSRFASGKAEMMTLASILLLSAGERLGSLITPPGSSLAIFERVGRVSTTV